MGSRLGTWIPTSSTVPTPRGGGIRAPRLRRLLRPRRRCGGRRDGIGYRWLIPDRGAVLHPSSGDPDQKKRSNEYRNAPGYRGERMNGARGSNRAAVWVVWAVLLGTLYVAGL